MELLLAIGIFGLASGGLALGLMLGRGPVRGSCGGLGSCAAGGACAGCPNRGRHADGEARE